MEGDKAVFQLDLKDIYRCMVTKVQNKANVSNFFRDENACAGKRMLKKKRERKAPCKLTKPSLNRHIFKYCMYTGKTCGDNNSGGRGDEKDVLSSHDEKTIT